jgi:cytochrome b561
LAFYIRSAQSAEQLAWYLMLHRSAGLVIAALTLARLGIRAHSALPAWPAGLPRWQQFAATASERALYLFLLAQPLLGIVGSLLRGNVVLFGIPVPQLFPRDRALAREILAVHHVLGVCLLTLIALHVAAALHHHFVRGDALGQFDRCKTSRSAPILPPRRPIWLGIGGISDEVEQNRLLYAPSSGADSGSSRAVPAHT